MYELEFTPNQAKSYQVGFDLTTEPVGDYVANTDYLSIDTWDNNSYVSNVVLDSGLQLSGDVISGTVTITTTNSISSDFVLNITMRYNDVDNSINKTISQTIQMTNNLGGLDQVTWKFDVSGDIVATRDYGTGTETLNNVTITLFPKNQNEELPGIAVGKLDEIFDLAATTVYLDSKDQQTFQSVDIVSYNYKDSNDSFIFVLSPTIKLSNEGRNADHIELVFHTTYGSTTYNAEIPWSITITALDWELNVTGEFELELTEGDSNTGTPNTYKQSNIVFTVLPRSSGIVPEKFAGKLDEYFDFDNVYFEVDDHEPALIQSEITVDNVEYDSSEEKITITTSLSVRTSVKGIYESNFVQLVMPDIYNNKFYAVVPYKVTILSSDPATLQILDVILTPNSTTYGDSEGEIHVQTAVSTYISNYTLDGSKLYIAGYKVNVERDYIETVMLESENVNVSGDQISAYTTIKWRNHVIPVGNYNIAITYGYKDEINSIDEKKEVLYYMNYSGGGELELTDIGYDIHDGQIISKQYTVEYDSATNTVVQVAIPNIYVLFTAFNYTITQENLIKYSSVTIDSTHDEISISVGNNYAVTSEMDQNYITFTPTLSFNNISGVQETFNITYTYNDTENELTDSISIPVTVSPKNMYIILPSEKEISQYEMDNIQNLDTSEYIDTAYSGSFTNTYVTGEEPFIDTPDKIRIKIPDIVEMYFYQTLVKTGYLGKHIIEIIDCSPSSGLSGLSDGEHNEIITKTNFIDCCIKRENSDSGQSISYYVYSVNPSTTDTPHEISCVKTGNKIVITQKVWATGLVEVLEPEYSSDYWVEFSDNQVYLDPNIVTTDELSQMNFYITYQWLFAVQNTN